MTATTSPAPDDVAAVAAKLTKANVQALLTLPLPRDADPVRWIAARPYGSTWRKSTNHRDSMIQLEDMGVVQRTVSRGETLWRLTKPLGLAVRAHLMTGADHG